MRLVGAAERERRTALAEAVRVEGEAGAAATLAQGQAEAEAMQRKADAYQRYGEAAVVDIIAGTLPQVVAEAARPMGQIDAMTVISTDGASQTVRNVASTVAQGQEMAKAMFGVDLATLVQRFTGSTTNGALAAATDQDDNTPDQTDR
jgi:flotillin